MEGPFYRRGLLVATGLGRGPGGRRARVGRIWVTIAGENLCREALTTVIFMIF
jgi:hypothetical protein